MKQTYTATAHDRKTGMTLLELQRFVFAIPANADCCDGSEPVHVEINHARPDQENHHERGRMMVPCAVCHKHTPEIGLLCCSCANRILTCLRHIEDLHSALSAVPIGAGTGTGSRTPGFGSRSPGRDSIIAEQDWRSRDDDHPTALGDICAWTRLVSYERDAEQPHTVTMAGETAFLRKHHHWITAQSWIDDYVGNLEQIRARLRALVGFNDDRVGTCRVVECGGDVIPTADMDGVECKRCHRVYTGLELVRYHDHGTP